MDSREKNVRELKITRLKAWLGEWFVLGEWFADLMEKNNPKSK